MLNRVDLIGRVGADPEINSTQDGRPVASLRIATSETWKDKNTGEKQERTEWHRVVCFVEPTCNFIKEYVHKGDLVSITGQLQTRKYQGQDGQDRYTTEVVIRSFAHRLDFLSSPKGGNYPPNATDENSYGSMKPRLGQSGGGGGGTPDLDDEIPF